MQELALINCRLDGRYDIHEQLGRGSYSEIYLAHDILASTRSPHHKVVIKALNVFLQDDTDTDLERTLIENFQNEATSLDRVRHPNIISRLGHGTARDLAGTVFHYLVLEYLPGGDLQSSVRNKELSLEQAFSYIEQICAGLGHAHSRGIIHRDIKPQNVLLTADRSAVKIADFGVARWGGSNSPITRVGTNIYAPPEHSPMLAVRTDALEFVQLTPAADIYSLAKTVYTLVSGEAPRAFANEQLTSLPEGIKDAEWADGLLRVLQKATHHDPRERHQTVEEFWTGLTAVREAIAARSINTVINTGPIPQPHVARGYTPIAPEMPSFEAVPEMPAILASMPILAEPPASAYKAERLGSAASMYAARNSTSAPPAYTGGPSPKPHVIKALPKKRRRLRRFAGFALFIGLFAGILYGTAGYMRGRGIFPEIRNLFRTQTATANTDIYLRPAPNTDNDPVGLVTKNSKVRIVNSQNNWYQVDVIEQGRGRPAPVSATRGWLNGKYLEIEGN